MEFRPVMQGVGHIGESETFGAMLPSGRQYLRKSITVFCQSCPCVARMTDSAQLAGLGKKACDGGKAITAGFGQQAEEFQPNTGRLSVAVNASLLRVRMGRYQAMFSAWNPGDGVSKILREDICRAIGRLGGSVHAPSF